MHDELIETAGRPQVRRAVVLVAASTLVGFLALVAISDRTLPPQVYAAARPLSAPAARQPGERGALLPPAKLDGRSDASAARDLRPAILLLVRFPCTCQELVRQVVGKAHGSKVRVYLVGVTGRTQVDRLATAVGYGVVPLIDEGKVLERTYGQHADAMLLLVRRDGIVVDIIDGVSPDIDLSVLLPKVFAAP